MTELHEELHELVGDLVRPTSEDQGTGHSTRRMKRAWASPSARNAGLGEQQVADLADRVRELLPWRSAETGDPVAMDVIEAGLLAEEHELHPAGTPYVTIVVDSWDAADAVRVALDDAAGLDEASWALDWVQSGEGFRSITIFPLLDDR